MLYKKEYNKQISDLIKNTKLSDVENKTLIKCLNCLHNQDVATVFEDMYKLYLNNYSMIELGKIYNRSARTIQLIFKKINLNRDRNQAQKIAAKKRNYIEIRKSFKKTMLERYVDNQLAGSKIEEFARYEFGFLLNKLIPDADIIIGINTMTNKGELDIPIILFYKNKVYKYGVEVDGEFFHDSEERKKADASKDFRLNALGYKIFRLKTKSYFTNESNSTIKYIEDLKSKLLIISNIIKEEICY
ncbi:hypothetical protein [Clostridium sp.]|uniref:hypothetical protein n=1 Tax=Clostridium sp. TaxID=1506 RepID=UPI002606E08C|nr:hypothetical protein [Clostridium sp.]